MSLAFLGDDIFVLIAAELDACMLGRLGCAAQPEPEPEPEPGQPAFDVAQMFGGDEPRPQPV